MNLKQVLILSNQATQKLQNERRLVLRTRNKEPSEETVLKKCSDKKCSDHNSTIELSTSPRYDYECIEKNWDELFSFTKTKQFQTLKEKRSRVKGDQKTYLIGTDIPDEVTDAIHASISKICCKTKGLKHVGRHRYIAYSCSAETLSTRKRCKRKRVNK